MIKNYEITTLLLSFPHLYLGIRVLLFAFQRGWLKKTKSIFILP
jgi:hypothetical protein